MNKSITQATQNDKQISKSIKRFFTRFHVSSALKASNAYKKKGVPVMEIFQYLFLLIFSNRSMYMNLITGRNTPDFSKDTVYRFMKMIQINWIRFTTILSSRIIREAIRPLDSECLHQAGLMEALSCRSTTFFFPQKMRKPASMKQGKWIKEQWDTGADSCP